MTGIPLILTFVVAIVAMYLVLSKIKLHPFLTLVGISTVLGIVAGIPLTRLPAVIGVGFSGIFTSIGIVVIFGVLTGTILEVSGASMKIATMLIKLVGKRSPTMSFMIMGWVVSVSLYCESGFVVLNPVRKSMVKCTGVSSVATTVGMGTGLYVSHALVPLTPGPLAVAVLLGLGESLPLLMLLAAAVSVPALVGAYFYAIYIGKRKRSKEDIKVARAKTVKHYRQLMEKNAKLPNGLLSLSPILVPFLLMVLGSVSAVAGWTGLGGAAAAFLGTPVIAMAIGVLFAVVLLLATRKTKEFNPITESTLKTAGPILCVTGAGGIFGHVIAEAAASMASPLGLRHVAMGYGDVNPFLWLLSAFLLAAVIKTAQGSSLVAMTATAGVMASMAGLLGSVPVMLSALTVMAIGAGSMVVSHANDPYFWIVAKLSGMPPRRAYVSHTVITLIAGVCSMAGVLALSLFVL